MFDEIGVILYPIAQGIQKRSLQAAEAVIQSGNMRFAESKGFRISLAGKPVDNRSAGITQSHYLGAFVDGFTCSIINCLPQDFHVVVGLY